MKKVAINQSNYLTWKGYFDIIHDVDFFVFYDDVQFTKNDWRHRNYLKGAAGPQWVSVPAGDDISRRICDVELKSWHWQGKHWKTISHLYGKAPHFGLYKAFLEHVYMERKWEKLSELNQFLIKEIAVRFLGITTTFLQSSDFPRQGKKQEAVLSLLDTLEADLYVSGPAAQAYIEPERFDEHKIKLVWKDYAGYPEYPQFHPPFEHKVSVLDLLFHVGTDAPYYIWGWREVKE